MVTTARTERGAPVGAASVGTANDTVGTGGGGSLLEVVEETGTSGAAPAPEGLRRAAIDR